MGWIVLTTVAVGAGEREEKEAVEEQNRGALGPSANGIDAHSIGRKTDERSERKDELSGPSGTGGRAEDDQGRDQNKDGRGNDVGKRERGMGCEEPVQSSELRWG